MNFLKKSMKKLYDSAEANGFISTINKFSLHKYFILPVDHLSVKLPVQRHEERGFFHSAPKVPIKNDYSSSKCLRDFQRPFAHFFA